MRFSLREAAPAPGPQGNFTSPLFQTLEGDVESMGGDTSKDQLLAADAHSRTSVSSGPKHLLWFSIALHVSFFMLHITIAGMLHHHPEHAFVFSVDYQGTAATTTTIFLQIVGISWTTLMLLTTQQLVVRRDMGIPRTLTSIHDSDGAWYGLGSSLLALWRQTKIPAHVSGTFVAVLYLSGIATLHITTPALFAVEVFNATGTEIVRTTGAIDWEQPATLSSLSLNAKSSGATMGFLKSLPDTKGLYNEFVYDVLDDNNGSGPVNVKAKHYDVDCSYEISTPVPNEDGSFAFDIAGILKGNVTFFTMLHSVGSYSFGNQSLRVDVTNQMQELAPYARIFYSPTRIVDSVGREALRVTLDPPIKYSHALSPEPWDNVTIPEVYVVVCALNVTNTTLSVDAQSKTPLEEQAFDSTRASDIFASAPDTSMFRLDGLELDLLWWRTSDNVPGSTLPVGLGTYNIYDCNYWQNEIYDDGESCEGVGFNPVEEFVMAELGLNPDIFAHSNMIPNPGSILLSDLQLALSRAVAAQFWSSTHLIANDFERNLTHNFNRYDGYIKLDQTVYDPAYKYTAPVLRNEAMVFFNSKPAARLNLVAMPVRLILRVISGTTIAGILIGVLIPIWLSSYRRPASSRVQEIDSFGLLQVIWLLQQHPELCHSVGEVKVPTISNLRKAGLVEISLLSPDLD